MAQLVVRNLPDDVKDRLKRRAKSHGHSLEAEVRAILEAATRSATIRATDEKGFGTMMAELFKEVGFSKAEKATINRGLETRRRKSRSRFAKFDT